MPPMVERFADSLESAPASDALTSYSGAQNGWDTPRLFDYAVGRSGER